MTSTVTVKAHCASNKEVQVHVNGVLDTTLQDGQSKDLVVYDDREVTVREVLKAAVDESNQDS